MKEMLPTLVKTVLLYVAAFAAISVSDRLNPSASDAGIGQSLMVLAAVGIVLLGALAYAFYKAVTQSSNWWAVVGLHILLTAISLLAMMR